MATLTATAITAAMLDWSPLGVSESSADKKKPKAKKEKINPSCSYKVYINFKKLLVFVMVWFNRK